MDIHFIAGAYGLACAIFIGFALYLGLGWRGGRLGARLLVAIVLSALWALLYSVGVLWGGVGLGLLAHLLDIARLLAWAVFLHGLLAVAVPQALKAGRFHLMALAGVSVVSAALVVAIPGVLPHLPERWRIFPLLALAIWLLVMVDQVYFNFPQGSRWGIKPLTLGLASVFAFDVYLYADAYLFARMDWEIVSVRGLVHAIVVPLLAMSAVRSRDWTFRITVSREWVFHSAALVASGAYLLLVAGAGYYVRWFGGSWGGALQTALLFSALLVLVLVIFSGSVRAWLRVVLAKNLFSYRYDYRQAWQKLTRNLGTSVEGRTLEQTVIAALADLVESPGGVLFLRDAADRRMVVAGQLNFSDARYSGAPEEHFCGFVEAREWIVDLDEWRDDKERYQGLEIPEWLSCLPEAWLVVPLLVGDSLLGFVVLFHPRADIEVDWEVRDLLKMAGRQVASYLAQTRAISALLEAEKFDSFNRMSAFVVHDLKNLVAQLSLMLKNADRHKDNPEFQADMLMTVENAAERMRALMAQLQNKTPIEQKRMVDLGALCQRIVATRGADGGPRVSARTDQGVCVQAHAERLERIVGHLVQNAMDATPEQGRVQVSVGRQAQNARLEISDTGCGMSQEFVRTRLFRPFQTTKSSGMGIGAYEVQQYIAELGGRIDVDSELGRGTTFSISIPLSGRGERAEIRNV